MSFLLIITYYRSYDIINGSQYLILVITTKIDEKILNDKFADDDLQRNDSQNPYHLQDKRNKWQETIT